MCRALRSWGFCIAGERNHEGWQRYERNLRGPRESLAFLKSLTEDKPELKGVQDAQCRNHQSRDRVRRRRGTRIREERQNTVRPKKSSIILDWCVAIGYLIKSTEKGFGAFQGFTGGGGCLRETRTRSRDETTKK
jgi:hypothetical protein